MDLKKIVLLVGALMVAVVTAIMAKNMFTGAGAKPAAAAAPSVVLGPKVLVAAKDLPVGTILDATSLKFAAWPKDSVQDAYYTQGAPDADPSKLMGTVVRYPIAAGQPISHGAVVGPQDRGFLAAALGPGMRAVTVPVNAASGLAGFVFPGDRVDIIADQEIQGGDGPPLHVAETVVRNVRVLAIDQRYTDKDDDGKPVIKEAHNVTLEVTPQIAEAISVAQSMGKLSLSLRSLGDSAGDFDRAVASGALKVPQGATPDQEQQLASAFANRPSTADQTYTTGGDISRYQRRTVAPAPSALASAPAAAGQPGGAPAQPAVPSGPVVRIARGNTITVVPVGAR